MPARWLGAVVAFAAMVALVETAGAQPANDDCANATVIASLPFMETVDTSTATNDGDTSAGAFSCANLSNSIWYQYAAGASDVILVVDTFEGSTVPPSRMQAYTGACGGLDAGAFPPAIEPGDGDNLAHRVAAGTSVRICIAAGSLIQVKAFEAPDFEIDPYGYRSLVDKRGIAGGPGGSFFVTWHSYETGYEHRGRLFDATGSPAGPQVVLDTGYTRSYFDVAARASDGFVVVWQDANDDVRAQRIDASGNPAGSSFVANQSAANYAGRLDTDANGDFVVAWHGGSPPVRFRLFDSAGTALGPEQAVAGASSFDQPDVARDDTGNFVVIWLTTDGDVEAQRFDASGTPVGSIITVATGDLFEPVVAASPTGEFFVVWQDFDSDSGIHGQAFDATGTPDGPPIAISDPDNVGHHRASIASDDAGNFVVVWEDDGGRADVNRNIEATARRIGPGGVTLGPEFLVNTVNDSDQYYPAVGVAPDGRFMVAWGDNAGYHPWSIPFPEANIGRIFGSDVFLQCPGRPSSTCRATVDPGKSKLTMRNSGVDPEDLSVNWKWVKGEATDVADFGDPLSTDDVYFCLYLDDGSGVSTLATQAVLPAGGICSVKPCWKGLGVPAGSKGFKYKDKDRTPNGVLKTVLKPGLDGKAKIVFKAGRGNLATGIAGTLPDIPIPLAGSVTAQLHQIATGECWGATFDAATAKRNGSEIFQASGG